MKLISRLAAFTQRALITPIVMGLGLLARSITSATVRLYVRGWLSAVEVRFLLGFCSNLHRISLRLAGRQ
ncbi:MULTISPECIES: hypothetical protein [unclassified Pseudomonas]|uniref:hypothetical protein n=1 Tax=unclassified Pseudomonas TaxID=196821 RepID=UPI002AC97CB3|nr:MULTISPECIES: hypothetical protein [unclassified Pseudomonas]MEB0045665.1 hypothetical protein [Pseudomonas sp. Dout3]MEB0095548.1 hypothetical protein [Pseudomonas sp. DC1.2]WPX61129.1 hypothetical protein RHM68_10985 [Pseudomonas sp. DC1.2]